MLLCSRVRLLSVLLIAGAVGSPSPAQAQFCNGFAYGNAGFGAGYSTFVSRGWGYGGGYGCFPRVSCWRPCWRPYRAFCGPGFSFGWPGYGFGGWAGSSACYGTQSVYLSAPFGGGATFFSGGIVPYPVPYAVPYAVPYVAPWYWFGANRAPAGTGQAITVAQAPAPRAGAPRPPVALAQASPSARLRAAHPASRRRAADLVATGDRQLCEAAGDVRRLKAAAESYRRAAAAAADDPDIHIRHAIALAAAGRHQDADQAVRKAVAIDGRLADLPGARPAGSPAPVVARGNAILRSIAAVDDGPLSGHLADVAAAWAGEGDGQLVRLAQAGVAR